jgi:diguanylate cyclase (GGDEF)-like protein/PAS domain S-box-containing protein
MPQPPSPDTLAADIQRLRDIIAHNSDWIWEVDAQGRYIFSSEHCRHLLGYAPEEMLGKTPFDFMPPDEAARVGAIFAEIAAAQRPFSGLVNRNVRADGRFVVLETSGIPLFDASGAFVGYRGIDRDITPGIGLLSQRQVQLEALYAAAPVALCLIDREQRLVAANDAMAALFGARPEQLAGRSLDEFLSTEQLDLAACFAALEIGNPSSGLELEWNDRGFKVSLQAVRDPEGLLIGLTLAFTDVTEQRRMRQQLSRMNERLERANEQLRELAEQDFLTGLPNRRRFDATLQHEVARALRERSPLSLIMLDVDFFKTYNDHYGHLTGDESLRQVGASLGAALRRSGDLVCRYGGEEFAVILPGTELAQARLIGQKLQACVTALGIVHASAPLGQLTISAGIGTLAPDEPPTRPVEVRDYALALIRAADESLYAAKRNGRNQVQARPVH